MINSINLRVDLSRAFVNPKITFHEGDVNGTELVLSVYDNNSEFDLTGCTAAYDATIAGYLAEEAAAATISGTNKITVPVTTNMTAFNGPLLIDVKIKKNDDILTVYTVSANVNRAVINGSTVIDISGTSIIQRLANAVPKTRKIAGIDLQDDILKDELFNALLGDKFIFNQKYCIIDGSATSADGYDWMRNATDPDTIYIPLWGGFAIGHKYGYMLYIERQTTQVKAYLQLWLHPVDGLKIRQRSDPAEEWSSWYNYLTTSNVYTKDEIDNMIGNIESLLAEV